MCHQPVFAAGHLRTQWHFSFIRCESVVFTLFSSQTFRMALKFAASVELTITPSSAFLATENN